MSIRSIVISGIVASLVIAMWEMVVEAIIPNGAGFFGPPIAIGATLVRDLQGAANPVPFNGLALILGLMGHMMNSVVLAAVFGFLVTRSRPSGTRTVGLGMVWGVVVFVITWFVVVPAVDPVLFNLNAGAFFIAHLMWGLALGFAWSRLEPAEVATTRFA